MKKSIPIANPKLELENIDNFFENFKKEMSSGIYVGGKNVSDFELSLAKFLGVKFVVALNSGTDALTLAIDSLGLKKGDEIILPSFTYFATAEAIMRLGATPVFVDVEKNSYCTSLKQIEKVVSSKTKCIIPVHLYGFDADVSSIKKFCSSKNIYLIEDTAQAFGSKSKENKFLGTYGNVNAFSNFPSKTLGGIGDGGFVTTNSSTIYKKITMLRNHGQNKLYEHELLGYNSRMDSLNAFTLNQKLKKFSDIKNTRNNLVKTYKELLDDVDYISYPEININHTLLNYFTITLPIGLRSKFQKSLNEEGIMTNIYYKKPLHHQKALKDYGYKNGSLKNTDDYSKRVLSLPLFSYMENQDIAYLKSKISKVIKKYGK